MTDSESEAEPLLLPAKMGARAVSIQDADLDGAAIDHLACSCDLPQSALAAKHEIN